MKPSFFEQPTQNKPPEQFVDAGSRAIQHENQEYYKEKLTDILTSPDAHLEILDLAKNGVLQKILPEVAELWGVRHTPEGYKAKFHREGDVFRHTLNVVRAINMPEVQSLVREIYPEIDEDNGSVVQAFFEKFGLELGWSLLLHDIGKKETQQEARDHDHNSIGYYSFRRHGEKSAELFKNNIAQRFNFTTEQIQKTTSLIKDHMIMHKLMRSKDHLSDTEVNEIMQHAYKEELLWHAFLDSIGNYTASENTQLAATESKKKKVIDFRRAFEDLNHDN